MRFLKIVAILVFLTLIATNSYADTYQSASFTGNIGLVSGGDGLTDWILQPDGSFYRPQYSSGTINNLNINGTPVWANMYWQAFVNAGLPQTGDPDVTLNGTAIHGSLLDKMPGEDGIGYYANVTNLMQSGIRNYTINGVNFGTPTPQYDIHQNGWGLDVVYSNPSLAYAQIQTQYSNDYTYWRSDCPLTNGVPDCAKIQGSIAATDHTAYARTTRVINFNFDPDYEKDRVAYITMHGAGAEPNSIRYSGTESNPGQAPKCDYAVQQAGGGCSMRPAGWSRTTHWYIYNGTTGKDWLIDMPGVTQWPDDYLFGSHNGAEWDVVKIPVTIAKGTKTFQLQGMSDPKNWYGESMALISTSFYLPINCPPPPTIPEPATMSLWGIGLGLAALKRKFFHKG